jgi:hypothetical protein
MTWKRRLPETMIAAGALVAAACANNAGGDDIRSGQTGPVATGECRPREGARMPPAPLGYGYTYAALPAGPCTGVVSCSLPVFGPCFGDPEYVGYPLNEYTCDCGGGTWSCRVTTQGGGVCGDESDASRSPEGGGKGAPDQ